MRKVSCSFPSDALSREKSMVVIPCPRCQQSLKIPTPAPEHIRCPNCGAKLKTSVSAPKPTTLPAGSSTMDQPTAAALPIGGVPVASAAPAAVRAGAPPMASAAPVAVLAGAATASAVPVANGSAIRAGLPVASLAPPAGQAAAMPGAGKAPKKHGRRIAGVTVGVVVVVLLCLWLMNRGPAERNVDLDFSTNPAPVIKTIDPRVKKAVDAGVAYLRKQVASMQRARLGEVGLVGVTLLECGVPTDDPDIEKLSDIARKAVPQITATYDAAPVIFFLDRLHQGKGMPESDRRRIQTLALRIVKGQNRPYNLWTYGLPVLDEKQETDLLTKLRDKSDAYVSASRGADLSNSQFAALALWTSRKNGVPVDVALRSASDTMRKYQDAKSGTWSYSVAPGQYQDTGTCVGLIMLALGRAVSETKETKEFLEDPAVVKALKHLGQVINRHVENHEKSKAVKHALPHVDGHGDLYFLWTLERTCLILGLRSLGEPEQDWHRWGTEILLDCQNVDPKTGEGGWSEQNGPVPDTCFALLFLMQANLFQDLSDKIQHGISATPPPAQIGPARKE